MIDLIFNLNNIEPLVLIFTFLSYAMIIFLALPVHEFAHAFAADKMGDPTPRWNGRLTLNPFPHIDIVGALMIFLFGFGYARPVPINPRNFRDYRKGIIVTALAGPLSNLVLSLLSLILLRILYFVIPIAVLSRIAGILLYTFAQTNIYLAVFNLMPVPPLDGYRIISNFLPPKWTYFIERNQWYITIVFLVIILSNRFGYIISFLAEPIYKLFLMITGLYY